MLTRFDLTKAHIDLLDNVVESACSRAKAASPKDILAEIVKKYLNIAEQLQSAIIEEGNLKSVQEIYRENDRISHALNLDRDEHYDAIEWALEIKYLRPPLLVATEYGRYDIIKWLLMKRRTYDLNFSLYHLKLDKMNSLIKLKHQSRLVKTGEGVHCQALWLWDLDDFLQSLKSPSDPLVEGAHFQLLIFDGGHWLMIDCYFKDNTLHTFTLDAYVMRNLLSCVLNSIVTEFPAGKHYYYTRKNRDDDFGLQRTGYDCQTFAFEHATMASKTKPDQLFATLANLCHVEDDSLDNRPYFTLEDLESETKDATILAPFLRGIQSPYRDFMRIAPSIRQTQVSKKEGGLTLEDWVKRNTTSFQGKTHNQTMPNKDYRYAIRLNAHSQVSLDKDLSPYNEGIRMCNESGKTSLIIAVEKKDLLIVKELLAYPQMDPNQADASGDTALLIAVRIRCLDIVCAILKHRDTDPNQANAQGCTPIKIAIRNEDLHIACAILMHEKAIRDPGIDADSIIANHRMRVYNSMQQIEILNEIFNPTFLPCQNEREEQEKEISMERQAPGLFSRKRGREVPALSSKRILKQSKSEPEAKTEGKEEQPLSSYKAL